MQTYFVRHTRKLGVTEDMLKLLVDEQRIAVHFPHGKDGNRHSDTESCDPEDYAGGARIAMRRLTRIAEEGAYVCAEYWTRDGALIGVVPPASQFDLLRGKWGAQYEGMAGRDAVMKSLRLQRSRWLSASEYSLLSSGRPRMGTICPWNKATRVRDLIEGITRPPTLESLPPEQQEILCAEALRMPSIAATFGLSPIRHLLFPIGRTRKDVDIDAMDEGGRRILMQVTFKTLATADGKLLALSQYTGNNQLVFICRGTPETPSINNGVTVISLDRVYELFVNTDSGRDWLRLLAVQL